MPDAATTAPAQTAPRGLLNARFISHGTLKCRDIERTRRFYEEVLGLEVVRTSPISLMLRLGGNHVYACVQLGKGAELDVMPRHYHNGLDVASKDDVDRAHALVSESAGEWDITRITKPVEQHGTYSFMFWDLDGNCWEILSNPANGYMWIFSQGDLAGKGHFDKQFLADRPAK